MYLDSPFHCPTQQFTEMLSNVQVKEHPQNC